MDLWSKITGIVSVELTSADPERMIWELVKKGVWLWDIQRPGALTLSFRLSRSEYAFVKEFAEKSGGKVRQISNSGVFYRIKRWKERYILAMTAIVLLLASVWLPNRILSVQVSGNEKIPTRLILEVAAQHGLSFGASRRELRSEELKNQLLGAVEELEWVGVNTKGSVATISVRERAVSREQAEGNLSNIVAASDGIIDEISLTRGTLLCGRGQAVKAGQILVSGLAELGICNRAVQAQAEIYAYTKHEMVASVPAETMYRDTQKEMKTKTSIQIGKKRINLYSDSGILLPTCGKMTQEYQLRLPGGIALPVAVIVQKYTQYETQARTRSQDAAYAILHDGTDYFLKQSIVAGKTLTQRSDLELRDGFYQLSANYECYEMISRRADGIYLEGDTNDDPKDSER